MLETTTAKYPYKKSIVKMYSLAKGLLNVSIENMFSGTRPDRMYVAFVSSEAVAGAFTKNPYNFRHYNINQIALYTPIKLSYDATNGDSVVSAFVNLFDNAGNGFLMEGMPSPENNLQRGVMSYFDLI